MYSINHWFSKCGPRTPLGDPECLLGRPPRKNYFHNNTKMLHAFFTHISHECTVEFSRSYMILQHIECRADKKSSFLLLSKKLKKGTKMGKECHPSH